MLITKEVEKRLEAHPIYSQDGKGGNAEVIVKFFNPSGAGTWLITEGEKQANGDWVLYGYCHIHEWEWGSVMFSELQAFRGRFGLGIERDMHIANGTKIKDLVDYDHKRKFFVTKRDQSTGAEQTLAEPYDTYEEAAEMAVYYQDKDFINGKPCYDYDVVKH